MTHAVCTYLTTQPAQKQLCAVSFVKSWKESMGKEVRWVNEEMGEAEKAFGPNRKQTNTISVYQWQVLWPIKKMVQC